jgi:hypothetical protein
MERPLDSQYDTITVTDVQLAAAYFPILVDVARHKHTITYTELVERAKRDNPGKEVVRNAIPTSTGRRLDVVKIFTDERGLPDLAALVVSKVDGEVGDGYRYDPVAARAEVFAFDWSNVSTNFIQFAGEAERRAQPKKKVTKEQAAKTMYDYFKAQKSTLPPTIQQSQHRTRLLELLQKGLAVEDAFDAVVKELQRTR